jgi:hypothetical protein
MITVIMLAVGCESNWMGSCSFYIVRSGFSRDGRRKRVALDPQDSAPRGEESREPADGSAPAARSDDNATRTGRNSFLAGS